MEKQLDSYAIVITTYWGIEKLNALVERGVITHLNVKVRNKIKGVFHDPELL